MVLNVHWSFLKNGCLLISSTPLRPSLTSLHKQTQMEVSNLGILERQNEYSSIEHGHHPVLILPVSEEGTDKIFGVF